ncbi:alpha/beta hydrolase family protein [Nesterenkonia ebinurensis]|uniref:alpha/beta hydrolase family protein n=1 Tax=Nesterenkonia ebinurensis TaxID=2608252 RepID=UPI00123CCED8|nr:alpha/beta fold hydrolase [Nesterenkonia ebinurensis]
MTYLTYDPPTGPRPVGVRDGELVDSTYPVVRAEDSLGRRIMLRVWYPASTADGEHRPYLIGEEARLVEWCVEPGGLPTRWATSLASMATFSVVDAPVAEGTFPTVIFSHGATAWVSQNTPLMEHLASHGYVVWSVAHPGEASGVRYPDGTTLRHDGTLQDAFVALVGSPSYQEKFMADIGRRHELTSDFHDDRGVGRWAERWVNDMRAVIDALETNWVEGIARKIVESSDLDAIATVGMSFGGSAAALTAQLDERVKAAVNLDGEQFTSDLFGAEMRVPLMHLATDFAEQMATMGAPGVTTIDTNEFSFEPLELAGLTRHVYRLRVAHVSHLELTDLVLIPQNERASALPAGGRVASQPTVDLLNATVGSFLGQELRGEDTGFPSQQLAGFSELTEIDLSPIRRWAAGRDGS